MKIKDLKIALTLIFIFLINMDLKADSYTLEELKQLRQSSLITQEEYEILASEIENGSINSERLYTLKIAGKKVSNSFQITWRNGCKYLSLSDMFNSIGFTNYSSQGNSIVILLGETLDEVKLSGGKAFYKDREILQKGDYPSYIFVDKKIYVEESVFKELFLLDYRENENRAEIAMELSFTPPASIFKMLDITNQKLSKKNEINEIIYKGKREFFNLGYARFEAGQSFSKYEGSPKYEKDWDGKVSYQGGFLYGETRLDYDFRENEFRNFTLDYNDIWKEHDFEIQKSSFTHDGEWSFTFQKNKSYYTVGTQVVITEKVPVGSRVELLYMGSPIALENEKDGEVTFSNSLIRSDRDYQLKIYHPDGRIVVKDIRTSEDYNRQQKGEIEYDISLNENKADKGYQSTANLYYGLTNNLTFGAGFNRDIVKDTRLNKRYINTFNSELTYGNIFNGISYTLQVNGELTPDSGYNSYNRNFRDKNQQGYLLELTKNRFRTVFEKERYGKYYEEKERNTFTAYYDLFNNMRVDYRYEDVSYREDFWGNVKSKDRESTIGISYDKSFGRLLFGSSASFDIEDSRNNEYNFNVYYSGFKNFTTKLENNWTNNGENYEVSLNVYNNNISGFLDVSAEVKYSDIYKETFGIEFSMTLDSWFKFDLDGDEHGNHSMRVGVDKIIDLKNPRLHLDNMDVSRATITTFVDANNNNIYDKGEKVVDGVEVTLGTEKVVTDMNGRAQLAGISNGVLYELKPTIKKPSYTMGNNIVKLQSNFSSDVDIHIPIKPMMNLSGYVNLDETLDIPESKVDEFYSDIIIEIIDMDGKEIEISSPDNTGYFDISGLFPEKYGIKVYYLGADFEILNLNDEIALTYNEERGFEFEIVLNVTDRDITMETTDEMENSVVKDGGR